MNSRETKSSADERDLEAVKPIEQITALVGEVYGMDLMTNVEEFISYWKEQGSQRGPEYHWRLAKDSDTVPEATVLAEMSHLASSCAICEKKKGTGVLREEFWYYHNEDSRAEETAMLFVCKDWSRGLDHLTYERFELHLPVYKHNPQLTSNSATLHKYYRENSGTLAKKELSVKGCYYWNCRVALTSHYSEDGETLMEEELQVFTPSSANPRVSLSYDGEDSPRERLELPLCKPYWENPRVLSERVGLPKAVREIRGTAEMIPLFRSSLWRDGDDSRFETLGGIWEQLIKNNRFNSISA